MNKILRTLLFPIITILIITFVVLINIKYSHPVMNDYWMLFFLIIIFLSVKVKVLNSEKIKLLIGVFVSIILCFIYFSEKIHNLFY